MHIGIVGMGCIGLANYHGFAQLGHTVVGHDPKLNTEISVVNNTDLCFVCVPTPSDRQGNCDTSIVESVLHDLDKINYRGIVAIRSTVIPGFTDSAIDRHKNLSICFVPEFLRERCVSYDFSNTQLLAVGTNDLWIYQKISTEFVNVAAHIVRLSPSEAEILKYYNNVYAALRVTFANVMFEICEKFGADYTTIKNSYMLTGRGGDMYLDANTNLRGYGGMCLPKDVRALNALIQKFDLPFDLLATVDHDNAQIKTTIFNGMRDED